MFKISFKLCFSLLCIILFIACTNFMLVNCGVQSSVESTQYAVDHIDSLLAPQKQVSMSKVDSERIHKHIAEMKECLRDIDVLRKGIFDSNTITFLCSFVLVFLAGILFNIEKRAKDKLIKAKEMSVKLDVEIRQMSIFKLTNTALIMTRILQFELSSNNYQIDSKSSMVIHEVHSMLHDLYLMLSNRKLQCITRNSLKENRGKLIDIKLILENESIYENADNKDKLTPLLKCKALTYNCLNTIKEIELYNEK